MIDEMQELRRETKKNIGTLLNNQEYAKAEQLLSQYLTIASDDPEAFSMQAVLFIWQGMPDKAMQAVAAGLAIDQANFDLLYNQAYLYEQKKEYSQAGAIYQRLAGSLYSQEQRERAEQSLGKLAEQGFINTVTKKTAKYKIAVICIKGLDSFIHDICRELSKIHMVKKVIVSNQREIYEAIDWADIVWLEWANDSTIAATEYRGITHKKVLVRLHGYEVFTDMPANIKWNVVDKLIFVAEHKRDLFFSQFGEIIARDKTCILRNGVDSNNFSIAANKTKNKNIACIGNINYRKGIDLLLQFFYDLLQVDPGYTLYIRGTHQDLRYQIAIEHMIQELKLQNKVVFVGRIPDINDWLKDMSFIVSSSLEESFHYSVGEGMLAGLKPVVHAWKESRGIWPEEYIFRNSAEFRDIILDNRYEPEKYRKFVLERYSLPKQMEQIYKLLKPFPGISRADRDPMVTIGITNFNAIKYLDECMQSMLSQTYKNLEIIIVDDQSTDSSFKKLMKYAKKYKQIRVLQHSENSGSPDLGRREIIAQAQGKYFMLFDSDDFFADKEAVTKLVRVVEENELLDYAYCDLQIVDEKSTQINCWHFAQYDAEQVVRETFQRGGSGILTMKGLFKTDFFKRNNISYLSNGTAGDTLTSLLCMQKGMQIKYLGEPLIAYRQHQNNFTFNLKKRIDSILTVLEYIVKNFSETVYFSEYNWNISKENRQANKFYLIAGLYYKVFRQFYEDNWKPWNNKDDEKENGEEIKQYLIELKNLLFEYSQIVLDATDCYDNDINLMREKLKSIYELAGDNLISNVRLPNEFTVSNKFLLRRIDNEIKMREALGGIFERLRNGILAISELIELANQYIIYPDQVLNNIGAFLFKQNYIEDAVTLFTEAYKINSMNQDVLLNLGIISYKLGDKQTAKKYFTEVQNKPENLYAVFQECEV
ncbi:glycosyltransferase [Propionispora hippei]|uniref:Glycosyltransferase involved in cell wall bisynthesis n=1 Tax=Propionispora hippei DSM 15287 TaxID=1123003 RepID=A0A1M6FGR0_9FIRM|nr:glycosyltransferase [Propionispora hippei]SHI96921.1 Glycosyltransferase involved in cell wall bisynthesis [Propionispora hippei DSM 15287]